LREMLSSHIAVR